MLKPPYAKQVITLNDANWTEIIAPFSCYSVGWRNTSIVNVYEASDKDDGNTVDTLSPGYGYAVLLSGQRVSWGTFQGFQQVLEEWTKGDIITYMKSTNGPATVIVVFIGRKNQ